MLNFKFSIFVLVIEIKIAVRVCCRYTRPSTIAKVVA